MAISGVALASVAAGSLLLYAGVTGKDIPAALQAIIQGKPPGSAPQKYAITSSSLGSIGAGITGGQAPPGGGPAPPGGGSDSANRALGKLLASRYGWSSGAEWQALDYGWGTLESGWNNQIYNGGQVGGPYEPDKAYGIPQALGHGPNGAPYPAGNAGNPPGAGGTSSATAQINWGLEYIRQTYGSPAQVPGWTGGGGYTGY